ncbi:MAG: carboxymuconolactone decarboxylase family protein [Bacteroidetes bacterium]|nr:MAG: carboxymuconolactone decarboxylase family protein [Bacteroidota bacterium]
MKKLFIIIVQFCLLVISSCVSSNKENKPVGGNYDENTMKSLVNPPKKTSFFLRRMIKIADKKAEKEMLTGRVLSWSSKIAISSGLLELYVEEGAATCLDERMIKILRIKISYTIPSPFALDINSWNYENFNITEEEIKGLQDINKIDSITSFSEKEKTALKYAHELSKTPISLNQKLLNDLRRLFSEKEIVTIAALTAKVNYWARLIEALRIKPAGYTDDPILQIDNYNTFNK